MFHSTSEFPLIVKPKRLLKNHAARYTKWNSANRFEVACMSVRKTLDVINNVSPIFIYSQHS